MAKLKLDGDGSGAVKAIQDLQKAIGKAEKEFQGTAKQAAAAERAAKKLAEQANPTDRYARKMAELACVLGGRPGSRDTPTKPSG